MIAKKTFVLFKIKFINTSHNMVVKHETCNTNESLEKLIQIHAQINVKGSARNN